MTLIRVIIALWASVASLHAQYGKVDLPLGPGGTRGTLHYFRFSSKTHHLKVIDQGKATPLYRNLDAAMRANGCIAGCNGGFFSRNGTPLGLVIANGRMQGTSDPKSTYTSGTIYVDKGNIRLIRTHVFSAKAPPLPRHVLQTGPFLVEGGKGVAGLSGRKFARRTILATDGRGNWIMAYAPPTTLQLLSTALAKPNSIPGFTISHAINLDGGSSSGLWIRQPNNPLYFKEVAKVRNFLGVVPK